MFLIAAAPRKFMFWISRVENRGGSLTAAVIIRRPIGQPGEIRLRIPVESEAGLPSLQSDSTAAIRASSPRRPQTAKIRRGHRMADSLRFLQIEPGSTNFM